MNMFLETLGFTQSARTSFHSVWTHHLASEFPPVWQRLRRAEAVMAMAYPWQVMPMSAAMRLAKRERMDLLPVAPNARPPVFRLGDANEAAKQARLRERDMRRREMENRRKTLMKEVRTHFRLLTHLPRPICGRCPLLPCDLRMCRELFVCDA